MAEAPTWWRLLPPALRRLPADLAAVAAATLLTVAVVLLPGVRETPLRVLFGLPFVLFLPGYAVVAALFPERGPDDDTDAADEPEREPAATGDARGIDGVERVALSFGLSIAVVPLVGLVLNFTPWGIRLLPVLVSVAGVTLAATAVAARRRWALPPADRFRVPYRRWYAEARRELLEPDTRADALLNVLLVASVVLAAASVTYAVAVPKQGEAFTELYLLTDQDGDLVADDYPTEFTVGESKPVVVGVGNHEHEPTEYTIVVELQRVENVSGEQRRVQANATNTTSLTVREERELTRFRTGTLAHNQTWLHPHNVTPTMTGERLRLAYLLYRGDPPADPRVETAYREVHLWVNVSATGQGA